MLGVVRLYTSWKKKPKQLRFLSHLPAQVADSDSIGPPCLFVTPQNCLVPRDTKCAFFSSPFPHVFPLDAPIETCAVRSRPTYVRTGSFRASSCTPATMADPWADPVGGGWGSTASAGPVGSPRKFSMAQSVDKLGVDSENVPLTALAGRSGRTPSKRMTMGGPTMVPYRGSPVTSPLVRRQLRALHRARRPGLDSPGEKSRR